ncbi:hypothetical protein ACQKNS_24465 [Peribacillus sp. NPDC094092]|uniref:hypothetical protein n=1 Tax=Peribacillus sp. NPDC094092 TaxID=3390611 RepID=UPI003D066310
MAIGGHIAITHQGVKLIDDIRGEYPPLSEVEKAVLKFLFDRDNMLTEENYPNVKDHITEGNFELAFYVKRLEENNLLRIEGNSFTNGGRMNSKYQNNVLMVDFNKIKITNSGIIALQFLEHNTI